MNVINYHDIRGPESHFYCYVLHDAHNACKAAVDREQATSELLEMERKEFAQLNSKFPFKLGHAVEEIVLAAYKAGRLSFDGIKSKKRFKKQVLLWKDMVISAFSDRNRSFANLPTECLYQFEIDRLLEVSLAYEKSLLPDFFASLHGASNLKNEYSKWRFCSVNTACVLRDPQWNFLFEDEIQFTLMAQPKVYIHIGAPKTGTTSIQDTMAMDKTILKEDKYFLALHGQMRKEDNADGYIIDNMLVKCDQLGACIWSDEQRQMVVEGSGDKDAGVCPEYLPKMFETFKTKAITAKSDIVISNEWLNRPTSEIGLPSILNGWDPTIVIYYRRYFDWLISAHYQWHIDISVSTAAVESLEGRVRLIDFVRMFCRSLFDSKILHSPNDQDLSFVDLTDINEYTYHIWKRYKKVPEFEDNIRILDFHDGHIIKSFYCDVLGADNACKLEKGRLETKQSLKTRSKADTALMDLPIGLSWKDHSKSNSIGGYRELGEQFKKQMAAKGLFEHGLPKECLTDTELTLLLNVSLAYEKILLPKSYASGGEQAAREHFAKTLKKGKFCSVDLERVRVSPKWQFLFENLWK